MFYRKDNLEFMCFFFLNILVLFDVEKLKMVYGINFLKRVGELLRVFFYSTRGWLWEDLDFIIGDFSFIYFECCGF